MLDISFVRQNPDIVKKALKDRNKTDIDLDQLLNIDSKRRQLIYQTDQKRSQQNDLNKTIKSQPTLAQIKQGKLLKTELKQLQLQLDDLNQQIDQVLLSIPNIPAPDVPLGKDDSQNQVIKTQGQLPRFSFKAKDHVELGKLLDIIDIDTAGQVSGSRFGYFKNQAAVLEMSLMFYAFNKLVSKGFIAMIPPAMVKSTIEDKMGYTSNKNLKDAYYLFEKDDLVFISSSEHSVVPYHLNHTIDPKLLPLKYVNFSPCFRRESGTYGKDTRGLFRVHFFNKVEMNLFSLPDYQISDQLCLDMLAIEEEIVSELGLPYQVMKCCTGDLPQPNRRMYDLNTWFPGQDKYRETHSCSNCGDYQARRLNIKTRSNGKLEYVHILNATVATDRLVLAIIENFQTETGAVNIPSVLHQLTGFNQIKPIVK